MLRSIPAPRWSENEIRVVAVLVARLACAEDDPFVSDLDIVSEGLVEEEQSRIAIRAQIEVMYARSFGLDSLDVAHIASSFNDEGAPAALRIAIADAFETPGTE